MQREVGQERLGFPGQRNDRLEAAPQRKRAEKEELEGLSVCHFELSDFPLPACPGRRKE